MTGKKILIVDDDRDLLYGLRVLLKAKGYDILLSTDGVSTVTLARDEKPDVIILDIGLPTADGFVVLDRMKSITSLASIPIIVLTARDPLTNKERALAAGARFFFHKPFDNIELLTAIEQAMGESQGSMQK